jgi:hypothetical protein
MDSQFPPVTNLLAPNNAFGDVRSDFVTAFTILAHLLWSILQKNKKASLRMQLWLHFFIPFLVWSRLLQ